MQESIAPPNLVSARANKAKLLPFRNLTEFGVFHSNKSKTI